MKEAQFQTHWRHYLEAHPAQYPEVYELKLCKKQRFPLAQIKPHQIEGLTQAQVGMYYKISDSPIFSGQKTRFTSPKPFDCLWIQATGYVCILFFTPRKPKVVVKLTVDEVRELMRTRKSVTLEELADYEQIVL